MVATVGAGFAAMYDAAPVLIASLSDPAIPPLEAAEALKAEANTGLPKVKTRGFRCTEQP
eukprot:755016-Pyramimonas_sp.AAC.1